MKNLLASVLFLTASCGPLVQAELDEPSLCITESANVPGAPEASIASATRPVAFAFDVNLKKQLAELGPNTQLAVKLLSVEFSGPEGAALEFADAAELRAHIGNRGETLLAGKRTRDGLALAAEPPPDLVPYLVSGILSLEAVLEGRLPKQATRVETTVCVSLNAKATAL